MNLKTRSINRYLGIFIVLFLLSFQSEQIYCQSFSGTVIDRITNEGIENVLLFNEAGREVTKTDKDGRFVTNLQDYEASIRFVKEGYLMTEKRFQFLGLDELLNFKVYLESKEEATPIERALDDQSEDSFIPIIELDDSDLEEDQVQEISSLLTASRDPFVSTAAYSWGPLRFRIRGYQSEDSEVSINGIEMNDLESGRVFWNQWGGLNDVTRNRVSQFGLQSLDHTFGDIGGATSIDMRATKQRKQLRAAYSVSNRSYFNRLMLTYTTGQLSNGWAFSFSGSKRWAQEGYIPGTFYDAYGYYGSAEKKLTDKHSISLSVFGAPNKRGKSGPATQLLKDIAGSNYYNPYWGYQAGEKRNSRVSNTHIPVAIFQHDWNFSQSTSLTTSLSYQGGRNGSTAINWANAPDPRADYYQKWPNYFESQATKDALYDFLSKNEDNRQIQWGDMYNRNWDNPVVIENANGSGNSIEGNRSLYIIEDRRYDFKSYQFNTVLNYQLSDQHSLKFGGHYNYYTKHNFKLVEDLLGGDFYLDENKYETDPTKASYNLDIQNKVAKVGDIIGYDYLSNIRNWNTWGQWNANWAHWDAFFSAKLEGTSYWRNGAWKNGFFPDNSQGDSEKKSFLNYGVKTGVTYKISGRQYILANALYETRAPYFRNAMISPRTQNGFRDLNNEKVLSGELSYVYRAPGLKAQITGYYTDIKGRINSRTSYFDSDNSDRLGAGEFGSILLSNIDQNHMGIEFAGELTLGYGFNLGWAAALGKYIYTSRMDFILIPDSSTEPLEIDRKIYSKNFFIPGTPQTALSVELKYNSKKYWFLSLKGNYLADRYLDFYPYRRTEDFTKNLTVEDVELLAETLEQELIPPAYTLDLFGGKSFRVKGHNIYLTLGINNILNDQNIITGGFEQFRIRNDRDTGKPDFSIFPNKYYYSYGLNYFLNVSLRL